MTGAGESVPKMWNECKVMLLHKGGYNSKNYLNFRLTALVNTVSKVFSAELNECKMLSELEWYVKNTKKKKKQ